MLTETQTLVLSGLLTFVMLMTSSFLRARAWTPEGLKLAFGNRANMPEPSPVAARADRAARNMLESLPMFLAVALAVRLAGKEGAAATLGANLFFWGRLAYFPVYVAGITYVRTVAWGVTIAGMVLMGAQALS